MYQNTAETASAATPPIKINGTAVADGTKVSPNQQQHQSSPVVVFNNNVQPNLNGIQQQQLEVFPSSSSAPQQQQYPAQQLQLVTPFIACIADELRELIDEMRSRDFDSIRFATYRTACKLRFIQIKTNVHLVDIWNMIESFRENGLNAIASNGNLKVSRLELLLTSIFHNLNKRLPASQQVDTDRSIATLLHFLLSAYDRQHLGRLTVFAIKVGLATLCAGKLVDKLRYVFSQISEPSGAYLDHSKFAEYLQQVLALPTAVFEGPTFGYSALALSQCFQKSHPEPFLDTILGECCPPCLMWLPLLHRMAAVENVYHPVVCDSCQVRSFNGFRYKCQRCINYQLCQSCFWRGRKSPTKQLAHTIQKCTLQCIPTTHQKTHVDYPPRPQRALDLANVVPSTPITGFSRRQAPEPIAEWTSKFLPGQYGRASAMDDEHKLIARYAAKLAGRTVYASSRRPPPHHLPPSSSGAYFSGATTSEDQQHLDERAIIARLEEENQQMLHEMHSLEQQQALCDSSGQLENLRERTTELEIKMQEKQILRRKLMKQLERLMAGLNAPIAPPSTSRAPSTAPPTRARSTTTAASGGISLGQLGLGDFSLSPQRVGTFAQMQDDLLQAADEITENMSELVRELEREEEEGEREERKHSTDEATKSDVETSSSQQRTKDIQQHRFRSNSTKEPMLQPQSPYLSRKN
uniref:ZZ-type domain-containing protein n=1 Tax=Meloidogyne hapla TaxID=6305 RepID=A0A1I8BS58_MELHA